MCSSLMRRKRVCRTKKLPVWVLFLVALLGSMTVKPALAAFTECPSIGQAATCDILITINPDGSVSFETDPNVPPYDGSDDTLVGVVNNSGATVYGVYLAGPGIFGFDGDGICTFPGGPPCGSTGYEGPGTTFTVVDANTGIVNFTNGLANNATLYFSLEGAPQGVQLAKTITIDPGHGTISCPQGRTGATGITKFPKSNPPPGKQLEYKLAFSIALQLQSALQGAGYQVTLTKTQEAACPSYAERTETANDAHSNIFLSVHLDGNENSGYNGTSALFNSSKSSAQQLASLIVAQTASILGRTNHGPVPRNDLAVLKPTASYMTAALAEIATITNSSDDAFMHKPTSTASQPALSRTALVPSLVSESEGI